MEETRLKGLITLLDVEIGNHYFTDQISRIELAKKIEKLIQSNEAH